MSHGDEQVSVELEVFGLTDLGRQRASNQDQFLIADFGRSLAIRATTLEPDSTRPPLAAPKGHIFLVADGMGGHAAGERASSLAVETIVEYLDELLPASDRVDPTDRADHEALEEALRIALLKSNERVLAESQIEPQQQGMGTTLTMACALWPRLYVIHVGDSRCYLLKQGELIRLTRDQTIAQELLDSGALSQVEAETAGFGHVLTSAIGGDSDDIDPAVSRILLTPGDTLLLCTDGLTNHVRDTDLKHRLAASSTAEEICRNLVQAANAAGGRDNVTVVVARFVSATMDEDLQSLEEETVEMPPISL